MTAPLPDPVPASARDAPATAAEAATLRWRAEAIRKLFLDTVGRYGRGHCGPCLSTFELLAVLYFREMRIDPADPRWPLRDRFVLSKGHAALGFYCLLAERGLIPHEELASFEELGSRLQGHVDSTRLPWVELTTGSLGQGLSVSLGLALGSRRRGWDVRAYCMLGDGETQEGNVWEAAMCAAKFGLDNLVAIVDYNGLQGGVTLEVMPSMEPYADKWRAFGWHAIELDGHDVTAILAALADARATRGRPTVLIARTVKGKGVSFMEGQVDWHGGTLTPALHERAMREVEPRLAALRAAAESMA